MVCAHVLWFALCRLNATVRRIFAQIDVGNSDVVPRGVNPLKGKCRGMATQRSAPIETAFPEVAGKAARLLTGAPVREHVAKG